MNGVEPRGKPYHIAVMKVVSEKDNDMHNGFIKNKFRYPILIKRDIKDLSPHTHYKTVISVDSSYYMKLEEYVSLKFNTILDVHHTYYQDDLNNHLMNIHCCSIFDIGA